MIHLFKKKESERNFKVYALSDKGKVYSHNEDNLYLAGETKEAKISIGTKAYEYSRSQILFAVSDGVGGGSCGELASLLCVEGIKSEQAQLLNAEKNQIKEAIVELCGQLNRKICEHEDCSEDTGATLALLLFSHGNFYAANVGDSRIYRFSNGDLHRLSKDHTRQQQMIDMGVLSDENNKRQYNQLLQCLGMRDEDVFIEPHIEVVGYHEKDCYLLCSDGLTDMVSEKEIEGILRTEVRENRVEQLYQKAMEAGGKDNITMILIDVGV